MTHYYYATILQCFTTKPHIRPTVAPHIVDIQCRIPALVYFVWGKDPVTFSILARIQESAVESHIVPYKPQKPELPDADVVSMRVKII